MKKEDLKVSFDHIKPNEFDKERMLINILKHSDRKKINFMASINFRKAIPALALTVIIVGGVITYNKIAGNNNHRLSPDKIVTDEVGMGREDMVAPLVNQFQIEDKHYILLNNDLRVDLGLKDEISESDIGEKITEITNSSDKNLIGSDVYRYIPARGEAVVAVKMDNEYQLFRFFTFESYNNNQDEDSVRYLELYGIYKADNIAKIEFIGHSEQSKLQGKIDIKGVITDRNEIAQFYSFYSVLKNSSDKYFDKLFNYKSTNTGNKDVVIDPANSDKVVSPDEAVRDIAPYYIGYGEDLPMSDGKEQVHMAVDLPLVIDKAEDNVISGDTPTSDNTTAANSAHNGIIDLGETGSGSIQPSQGSAGDALSNPITIRIYNQSGIYYDSIYYTNIGFISRYKVSDDFASFIDSFMN